MRGYGHFEFCPYTAYRMPYLLGSEGVVGMVGFWGPQLRAIESFFYHNAHERIVIRKLSNISCSRRETCGTIASKKPVVCSELEMPAQGWRGPPKFGATAPRVPRLAAVPRPRCRAGSRASCRFQSLLPQLEFTTARTLASRTITYGQLEA